MITSIQSNGKLDGLEAHLRTHIIGQDEVIDDVLPSLKIGELGLAHSGRPKASFLFLGPTGVGKTELAKCFTEYLFGKDKLLRLDMSEFQNQSSLPLLLGEDRNDAGYLGQRFEEIGGGGTLLLDEIEKAHPRILDLLLQILDDGRVTLANRTTLDLSQFYVVMTSNIGSQAILTQKRSTPATRKRFIETQAQAHLRPELFARIDRVEVFASLDFESQEMIADLMIDAELSRLAALGHALNIDAETRRSLATKGYHPKLGLRPMRRTISHSLAMLVLIVDE